MVQVYKQQFKTWTTMPRKNATNRHKYTIMSVYKHFITHYQMSLQEASS